MEIIKCFKVREISYELIITKHYITAYHVHHNKFLVGWNRKTGALFFRNKIFINLSYRQAKLKIIECFINNEIEDKLL